MRLESLEVRKFRLYEDLVLGLERGFHYFFGKNAQGKTSLLEIIRLLSTGKSYLARHPREMIRFGEDHFFLKTRVNRKGVSLEIRFGQDSGGKMVSVSGQPLKTLSGLLGCLDTVLFTPQDFELVISSPEIKRRFLDIQLSQASEEYLKALKQYHHILKQRNALLKQPVIQTRELESWTEALAEQAATLVLMRGRAVLKIEEYAHPFVASVSGGSEKVELKYRSFTEETSSTDEIRKIFMEKIRGLAPAEKRMGYTLLGPHRDDIEFSLNGRYASRYASRGQMKSIALAVKFAESRFMTHLKGFMPVFLIDDVFSELDEDRQRAFFEFLSPEQQVFCVTTLSPQKIPYLPEGTFYEIQTGTIDRK